MRQFTLGSVGNLEQAEYNTNRYRQLLLDINLCYFPLSISFQASLFAGTLSFSFSPIFPSFQRICLISGLKGLLPLYEYMNNFPKLLFRSMNRVN